MPAEAGSRNARVGFLTVSFTLNYVQVALRTVRGGKFPSERMKIAPGDAVRAFFSGRIVKSD
jgi:hypothetical protein